MNHRDEFESFCQEYKGMGSPFETWIHRLDVPLCQIFGLVGDVERPPLPPDVKARLDEAHRKAVRERDTDGR